MPADKFNPTTTDAGVGVASEEHSLSVRTDGSIVLHDHYLIEQMANFNRERIAERQPHAKGCDAFRYFSVTQDVSNYTKAAARMMTILAKAGTLEREVFDDATRDRFVVNAAGHLQADVARPVLEREFEDSPTSIRQSVTGSRTRFQSDSSQLFEGTP